MSLEVLGGIATAFAGITAANVAGFLKIWTYIVKRERFHEARAGLLWEMIDLRDHKLEEAAKEVGVSVNGQYEAEKRAQRFRWEELNRRGEA